MSPYARWILGLSVLLAGCAVNPVTPPAVVDEGQQPAPLASASPTFAPATDPAGQPTSTQAADLSVAQPSATANGPLSSPLPAATVVSVAAAVTASVAASPTPVLIVVAEVPLVPAPTATTPPVVVSVARPKPTTAPAVPLAPPVAADAAAAEQYTVDLINAQRSALGLTPLSADPTLMGIANSRVADMVARGYTGHNDPVTGVPLGPALMKAAGYGLVGENWFGSRLGPPTIADVAMNWFMTDAPHYQNILNSRYSGVGVGIAYNGKQWLLVQDFAGS